MTKGKYIAWEGGGAETEVDAAVAGAADTEMMVAASETDTSTVEVVAKSVGDAVAYTDLSGVDADCKKRLKDCSLIEV